MTQEQLAECVGCSLVMIRKIESDERRPSEQITLRLADCFGVGEAERPLLLKVARRQLAVDRLPLSVESEPIHIKQISVQSRMVPGQITHFVGRSAERRQISQRLARQSCRLLTLLGPGGIGKTRLAVETAATVTGFNDGIFYVSLAPLISAEYLALTIAGALDVRVSGSADPAAELVEQLASREVLLVLDNFEHLLEGAALLGEILQHAPRVKMLVTSREPLDLYGEWLHPVRGMTFPSNGHETSYESYDAVQMFVETAQRIDPDFSLDINAADVGRICQLVEGNPLGIELAAAQLRVLSCHEIAEHITSDFGVLTASLRNVPERHRSMRAVFDHSWSLLTNEQQAVLARLSVFRGGFSLDAAEQVAGADLGTLSALIDKSLIRTQSAASHDMSDRYDLHELLRQYSSEKLASDPLLYAEIEQTHSAYFSEFLYQCGEPSRRRGEQSVLAKIDLELQNILAAWHHALIYHQTDLLERAINPLHDYCIARARFHEGRMAFQGILDTFESIEAPDEGAQRVLVMALSRLSHLQFAQGGAPDRARLLVEKSLTLAHALGWREEESLALSLAGLCARSVDEAYTFFEKALKGFREVDYSTGISDVCQNLGLAAAAQGSYTQAIQHFEESTAIATAKGDAWGMNVGHFYLGKMASLTGEYEAARQHLSQSLALSRENNFRLGIAENSAESGIIAAWKLADHDRAISLLRESLSVFAEIGSRPFRTTIVSTYLGSALCALGKLSEAETCLVDAARAALSISTSSGQTLIAAEALTHLGIVYAHTGQRHQALKLLCAVTHLDETGILTAREVHPVALQEINLRIELAMVAHRLHDALDLLRIELNSQCGSEIVATGRDSHLLSEIIENL